MNDDPQDFDQLKVLLAQKRQAEPPHDFFLGFSQKIREGLHQPPERITWWQRLRTDIDLKACALGVVVCGLVLYAMLAALGGTKPPPSPPANRNPGKLSPPTEFVVTLAPALQPIPSPEQVQPSTNAVILIALTNPPPQSTPSPWR